MTKQEKFLWLVQTMLLTELAHWSIWGVQDTKIARADTSLTGNWTLITEAVWACERIPAHMDAYEAAREYVHYMLPIYRHEVEAERGPVPAWFARA